VFTVETMRGCGASIANPGRILVQLRSASPPSSRAPTHPSPPRFFKVPPAAQPGAAACPDARSRPGSFLYACGWAPVAVCRARASANSRVRALLRLKQPRVLEGDHGLVGEDFEQLHVSFGERRRRKISFANAKQRDAEYGVAAEAQVTLSGQWARSWASFATREVTREDDCKTPINPGSRVRTLLLPRAAEERRRCRLAQGSWRAIRACTIRPIDRRCSRSFWSAPAPFPCSCQPAWSRRQGSR